MEAEETVRNALFGEVAADAYKTVRSGAKKFKTRRKKRVAKRRETRYVPHGNGPPPFKRANALSQTTVAPGTLTSMHLGADIALGTGVSQRLGNSIVIRGVHVCVSMKNTGTAASDNFWVRFALVRQTNTYEPTKDFFRGYGASPEDFGAAADRERICRPLNEMKFKTLWSKKCRVLSNSVNTLGQANQIFGHLVKMNQRIHYHEDGGTHEVEEVTPNLRLMWWLENDLNAIGTTMDVNVRTQIYYLNDH